MRNAGATLAGPTRRSTETESGANEAPCRAHSPPRRPNERLGWLGPNAGVAIRGIDKPIRLTPEADTPAVVFFRA